MEENNCIAICFPQGAGGHIAGRILASCNNVAWYDHRQNGKFPWDPYTLGSDYDFSPLHFNKRFAGAEGKGICKLTVPPVLDMARKQELLYNKDVISKWKESVRPNNLIYTLHANLDEAKDFFKPAKFLVIIPDNLDQLIDRWLKTTYYYYVDPKDKTYRYGDLYQKKADDYRLDIREVLKKDMIPQIENYKRHATEDDIVISQVSTLYDCDNFRKICRTFNLSFNLSAYEKTVGLAKRFSQT